MVTVIYLMRTPQSNCEDKEKKLHKELLKGNKVGIVQNCNRNSSCQQDIEVTKQKLEQATSSKELAKVEGQ